MAKPLHTTPPTSSVARLLDHSGTAADTGPGPKASDDPNARSERPDVRPVRGRMVKRELVLTLQAEATFQALVDALRSGTACRLTASHAFRALMRALEPAMKHINRAARSRGPLSLPSNAPGYEKERSEFEAALADILRTGWTQSN
ncbi:MAG: hypothetical protein KF684_13565 [Phycisphaeraceae bacterium]|nr:hypothetical protein [Phycisphaeraceae bacterium]